MAAVSVRRRCSPRLTVVKLCARATSTAWTVRPPSGPIKTTTLARESCTHLLQAVVPLFLSTDQFNRGTPVAAISGQIDLVSALVTAGLARHTGKESAVHVIRGNLQEVGMTWRLPPGLPLTWTPAPELHTSKAMLAHTGRLTETIPSGMRHIKGWRPAHHCLLRPVTPRLGRRHVRRYQSTRTLCHRPAGDAPHPCPLCPPSWPVCRSAPPRAIFRLTHLALLTTLCSPATPLQWEDVDELERVITEGKLPVHQEGVFDKAR